MSAFMYANISMEILCCAICLVLLFCVLATENGKERLNRIFISVVCCHIPLLLADTAIFALDGKQHSNFIFRAAYFLSFILGAVLLILFTRYLRVFIEIKATVLRKTIRAFNAAVAACGVNLMFVLVTQFNGFYYSIGGDNTFFYGDWYWLSQLLAFICIALNTGVIIAHRKDFETRELMFLLSYAVLPTIALIIQNVVKDTIASIDVATTLTIVVFYAGIQREQAKRLKEKELELTQSRITVMLSQIQPHFLYNSLTAIQELCRIDPETASQAVGEFSKYLRGNLDSLALSDPISFDKELNHVENYLRLEKMRFGPKLNIVYNISVRDFNIPALTLQPVVENAVRHGVTKREEGGTVTVTTAETESGYTVTVTDDGVGFNASIPKQDGRSHIGMENVRSRLAVMCGGALEIQSRPGVGTTAEIIIPKGGTSI